jgi:hypothetical protein
LSTSAGPRSAAGTWARAHRHWLGRSWVREGDAYVEASLRVAGVTEVAIHEWLQRWCAALATASYWYRRVERGGSEALTLMPFHFAPVFHDLLRLARCHVKPEAVDAAIKAFVDAEGQRERASANGDEPRTFFEGYAAAHPETAMPVEGRFVSGTSASDILLWLERLEGLQTKVTAAGALEIAHVVLGGTLILSPGAVRRVAVLTERLALSVEIEGAGALEIIIGPQDFHFLPCEGRVVIEGVTFVAADMPARIAWFETRKRLRALEREMAWAGPLGCGGDLAWMHGALAGAERIGLVCTAERGRLERVLAAARRSRVATEGAIPDRKDDPMLHHDDLRSQRVDAGGRAPAASMSIPHGADAPRARRPRISRSD